MKKNILILIIVFITATNTLFADDKIRMRPQERLIFDFFIDVWQNTPNEMDLQFFNRGVNVSLFYDYPLGYSNFSIAPGVSFTSHNMYSDHWYKYSHDNEKYDFVKIDDDLWYDRNKISINYLEIPLEFRFRTRPRRDMPHPFRIAAGAKFGYLLQAHTKYSGNYPIDNNNTREVKFKRHDLNNIEKWRYGIMARIGYGYVNLTAYYPLTNIFKNNSAEEMLPVSIGLSFIIN